MKNHVRTIFQITAVSFITLFLLTLLFFNKMNFFAFGTKIMDTVSGNEIASGTYQGIGRGGHSMIKVEVVINDEQQISRINILNHDETPDIAAPALEEIPKRIIQNNSTDIEVISGATLTSEGIMEAVNHALK